MHTGEFIAIMQANEFWHLYLCMSAENWRFMQGFSWIVLQDIIAVLPVPVTLVGYN